MSKKSTCLIGRVFSLASSSSSTANPTANSQDDIQAIVSPLGYKSAVWKYFGFLKKDGSTDKTHAICKKCRSAIKYSGNTTNLSGHLIKKHGIDPHEARGNVVDVSDGSSALSTPALSSFFPQKLNHNSKRAMSITAAISTFICKDMRPYCVVENAGFRELLHTLEPKYTIPSDSFLVKLAYRSYTMTLKTTLNVS
jgi:hypothetical protein